MVGDEVKLSDYGHAKQFDLQSSSQHMSPEFNNLSVPKIVEMGYSEQSEIWALGIILIQMVCGNKKCPFDDFTTNFSYEDLLKL